MLKILRVPFPSTLSGAQVTTLSSIALAGATTIKIATDAGITVPQEILLDSTISGKREFIKITAIANGADIVATLEAALKNDHALNSPLNQTSGKEYILQRTEEDLTYTDLKTGEIDPAASGITIEYTTVKQSETNISVISGDERQELSDTANYDESLISIEKANAIIFKGDTVLTDEEKYQLLIDSTMLVYRELGFSISKKEAYDIDDTTINAKYGRDSESTIMTKTRPVNTVTKLTIKTATTDIDIDPLVIYKKVGCVAISNPELSINQYDNTNTYMSMSQRPGRFFNVRSMHVNQGGRSMDYADIEYEGGLEVIPSAVVGAIKQYITVLIQISSSSANNASLGIKKQKHYNREITYFERNQADAASNPLIDSVSSLSAGTMLSPIKVKYGGF